MATPTPTPELSPDELSELLSAYMPDIPGYRVMRRLGQGGMSYVYLGLQESLDRQVAIKVIVPTALKDEISKLRFEREARTIANLQHPAIVSIYDVGRTELGLLYYVMPYLPRGHFGQRDLRNDEPRLLAILRALLWALDYAHERGVVHRDIKSENVLFDNVDRPLLTDFGIAMHRGDRNRVTDGGFALGSATHMAPEQARGERVDGRADLYSIGVLAYEQLVGELPFQADGPLPMAVRHAVDPVPRLPAAKAHWQEFIDRALAKSPDARFANAQEMMAALDRIERERTVTASPPQPQPPEVAPAMPVRASRRAGINPAFVAVAACVVLLLAIVVAMQALNIGGTSTPSPSERAGADAAGTAVATAANDAVAAPGGSAEASQARVDASVAPSSTQAELDTAAQATGLGGPMQETVPALDSESSGALIGIDDSALILDAPVETALSPEEEAAALAEAALPADQRALRSAARQITRLRLTQPPGDNAFESLQLARSLQADPAQLARLGKNWLIALQPHVAAAFESGGERPELRLYTAARGLAEEHQLRDSEGWQAIEQVAVDWLRGRLRVALKAQDLARIRAIKSEAAPLGIAASALEPEWSQGIVTARVGERVAGAAALLLRRLPQGERPGLAAMPGPVTRAEYALFASGREGSNCRVRSATFNLRKRRWNAPGFEQRDDQPVVCVSLADAVAYAAWLGQRDGQTYRLATSEEWSSALAADSAAIACRQQPASCTGKQHIREWPAACGPSCAGQPVLGFSWRDATADSAPRDEAVDAAQGYDDVGFRLVRDVSLAELEQR
jgi:serine/threonine-protein kinase PpkA